jgi:hypothetical protein
MRTEPVLAEAEHPLAHLEGGDPAADRLDLVGELASEDRRLRLRQTAEEPNDPRWAGPYPEYTAAFMRANLSQAACSRTCAGPSLLGVRVRTSA